MSDLEKKIGKASLAAIAGIGAAGVGSGIMENQKKYNEDKKEQDLKRLKEKFKTEEESGGSNTKATPVNYKKGGTVSSASKRADGCAIKGKTKGRMV